MPRLNAPTQKTLRLLLENFSTESFLGTHLLIAVSHSVKDEEALLCQNPARRDHLSCTQTISRLVCLPLQFFVPTWRHENPVGNEIQRKSHHHGNLDG